MSALTIAWFISAHGFGHAARASALMAAIRRIRPDAEFLVYTTVPAWFFDDPAIQPLRVRNLETDVGVVQKTPLEEDPEKTLHRLNAFFPYADSYVRGLGEELNRNGVRFVVADISPGGILAAAMAGIPSVLVENFTWDWIYAPYRSQWPGFDRHIAYLSEIYDAADVHIQTLPVCRPAACHLTVGPISREARAPAGEVRARLGIAGDESLVLLSLGGTPAAADMLSGLKIPDKCRLVAPGGPECLEGAPGVVRLPAHSEYYHPDLIRASDAVIGKAGYSTIAEIYRYGIPFGFVSRPAFREAPIMEAFILAEMNGRRVSPSVFQTGGWGAVLEDLVAAPRRPLPVEHGAAAAARFLMARFGGGDGFHVTGG
jgi:hypothetical protein